VTRPNLFKLASFLLPLLATSPAYGQNSKGDRARDFANGQLRELVAPSLSLSQIFAGCSLNHSSDISDAERDGMATIEQSSRELAIARLIEIVRSAPEDIRAEVAVFADGFLAGRMAIKEAPSLQHCSSTYADILGSLTTAE